MAQVSNATLGDFCLWFSVSAYRKWQHVTEVDMRFTDCKQLEQNQHYSKLAEAVTFVTCIPQVFGSNLGRDTDYPHLEFHDWPQSVQEDADTVSQIRR
jgi:hypothetical protein